MTTRQSPAYDGAADSTHLASSIGSMAAPTFVTGRHDPGECTASIVNRRDIDGGWRHLVKLGDIAPHRHREGEPCMSGDEKEPLVRGLLRGGAN